MFRKMKPVVMLLIISLVSVLAFAGCGNSSNGGSSKTSTAAGNGSNSGKSGGSSAKNSGGSKKLDPTSAAADMKKIDAVIAKIKTPDYFKNTPTFTYTVQFPTSPQKDGSFAQKYYEKKFNIKLKFIRLDSTNRTAQLNRMFATGTIPDFVADLPVVDVTTYAKQGLLAEVPVSTIKKNMPNYYPLIEKTAPLLFSVTKVDGKNMGLARLNAIGSAPRPAVIRADWLKNVGINKVPKTLDELEQAFIKFRNDDPNKDGKKDTYALSNPSTYSGQYWFQSIFGAYGTNPFLWVKRGNKLQFGFTTQETKDALKRLHKWYQMGLIDPQFITDNGRSTKVEDLAAKFAEGKIGYMDNLTFDDSQWDDSGQINFVWVKHAPQWQKFFKDNVNNPEKMYANPVFTTFNDKVPQPIYLDIPPVTGPDGNSGYIKDGALGDAMVFGKQLEKNQPKLDKLLHIIDYINSNEQAYLYLSYGPSGFQWKYNAKHQRLLDPSWTKHEMYDPHFEKMGYWITNPVTWSNPKFFDVVGGPRAAQRFRRDYDIVKKFKAYQDAVQGVLPSEAKYSELTTTRIQEYVVKAITGDLNIDKTFDATVSKWYQDGGTELTKEANQWYQKVHK